MLTLFVCFFLLTDKLDPQLFLWKLSCPVEKMSFHGGKDCYITGYKSCCIWVIRDYYRSALEETQMHIRKYGREVSMRRLRL